MQAHHTEIWRDIPWCRGFYQASSLGRVRSMGLRNGRQGTILTMDKINCGYLRARIINKKKRSNVLAHRLVLEAFVGPCPPGYECDHINEIRDDNRLENLRWMPMLANRQRRWRHR